jgi:membrane protein required for beta-lactamase induction
MRLARALLFGALAGMVGLSALVTLLHALLAPELMRDGLYIVCWWFVTGPFGAVLGGLSGAAASHARRHGSREAGLIRATGGGVVAFLFGLVLLVCLRLVLHGEDWYGFARVALPLFGVPFVWAAGMASRGLTQYALAARREAAGGPETAEDDWV